jgi:hypothetical protein
MVFALLLLLPLPPPPLLLVAVMLAVVVEMTAFTACWWKSIVCSGLEGFYSMLSGFMLSLK